VTGDADRLQETDIAAEEGGATQDPMAPLKRREERVEGFPEAHDARVTVDHDHGYLGAAPRSCHTAFHAFSCQLADERSRVGTIDA
jgi:hypothetical protein